MKNLLMISRALAAKKKLFTMLLCLIVGIGSMNAQKNVMSGSFKNGGTWQVKSGVLYVDAEVIPDAPNSRPHARKNLVGGQSNAWENMSPWWGSSEIIYEVQLSANVSKIGKYAFAGLVNLKKVSIENQGRTKNIEICQEAFSDCWRLTDFDFSRVAIIGEEAFARCYSIKQITLPVIQSIGRNAFDGCISLWLKDGGIALPGNTIPSGLNNMVVTQKPYAYASFSDANDNLATFITCTGWLKVIVPPAKLSSYISTYAKSYTWGLIFHGGDDWNWYFDDSRTGMEKLYIFAYGYYRDGIPDFESETDQPWYLFRNKIRWVEIYDLHPYGCTIGKNAFKGCSIESLDIFASTFISWINIGESAFDGCSHFTGINIMAEIKNIGKRAFANTSLKKIDLSKASTIDDYAFDGCSINNITFGSSISSIGQNAFRGAFANGGSIYVSTSVPTTAGDAFSGASSRTTVHVDAEFASGYQTTAPWNRFDIDMQVTFPVGGTWGIGYGKWVIDENGTLIVKKGTNGFDTKLPDYANASDQPWYLYRDFIKKIEIEEGLQGIGKNAFATPTEGESQIKEVEIPATVTEIGENAFKNNDQIEEVQAEGVQTIASQAFENCSSLEKVKFGDKVTSLGSKVFNNCGLVDVMALKAATPPAVTVQTFQGLGRMSTNAPAKAKAKYAARKAKNATGQKAVNLEVPDAHISKYLAAQYWNLFSFEYIGEHGGIVESGQAYDGLYVLYSDSTMIVSASAPTNPQNINQGFSIQSSTKPKIKRVEIQGTLEKLGYQFEQCPNLEEVVLGPTFTTLYGSFYQCPKLKSINLENVLYIRPNGVRNAFEGCTSLTSVNIPNALEVSGFKGCTSLASVTLGGNAEIESNTFENCSALTSIDLGNAKVTGADACFSGCTGLASVKFSGTKIPDEFFKNCSALTTIDLGSQIEEIGESAFEGTGLQKIYIQRPSAPDTHADAFKNLTVSNIQLYRPYAFRYGYRTGDWYDMDWMDDEDYEELDFPMYFSIGSNAVGMIDESENLFIDAVTGGTIVANANDYIAPYAPYILNEIHIGNDVTSLPAGTVWTGMFHWVPENASRNLVIGSGLQTIGDYAFYNNGWDCDLVIDCYALTPPTMQGAHVFNWNKVQNGSQCAATLNVVNDPDVVAAYRADPYWSKFSIAGTLAPADAPTECTVTFVDWDGTVLQTTTTRPGMSVTPPEDPVRPGYEFRGWDSQEYGWVLTDLTITATYYEDMYTVRFYDFDGTRLSEQQVRHGQAAVAPADPAEREGYTYAGWSEDFSHVTMDLNICAVFNPIMFTVTFQDKDGSPLSTQQVQWGTAAEAPEAPEVEGYEFVGWDTDFSCVKTDLFVKAVYQEAVSNVVSYVCDFTAKKTNHQNYNDTWTYDTDWDVFGGANNNGQWAYAKFGGKSTTLASANPVYVADNKAFGREIKQIRVTFPSGSFSKTGMSANEWGAKVYSDLACTQLLYTVTGGDIDANGCTLTLMPESGKPWEAGSVIRVYWDLANTSSTNGIVLVDKIEYLTASDDNRPLWVTTTGIEDVSIQPSAVSSQKILHESMLYIIRPDGAIYNAQGARIK